MKRYFITLASHVHWELSNRIRDSRGAVGEARDSQRVRQPQTFRTEPRDHPDSATEISVEAYEAMI